MQTMVPVAREAKNYDFHLDLNQINNNINTQPRFNSMLAHGTNNFSLDNQRKLSNFNSIGNGSIMQDEQIRLRENPMKKKKTLRKIDIAAAAKVLNLNSMETDNELSAIGLSSESNEITFPEDSGSGRRCNPLQKVHSNTFKRLQIPDLQSAISKPAVSPRFSPRESPRFPSHPTGNGESRFSSPERVCLSARLPDEVRRRKSWNNNKLLALPLHSGQNASFADLKQLRTVLRDIEAEGLKPKPTNGLLVSPRSAFVRTAVPSSSDQPTVSSRTA